MSIDQLNKVDLITIDRNSGDVWLTISDHHDWGLDEMEHLLLLQEKINGYLRYIEGGELFEHVPDARNRKIVINVSAKFPLSQKAEWFYKEAGDFVKNAGYQLQFRVLTED